MQIYDIPIDRHGRELTTVGTADFPISIYHTDLSKNILGYVNWHWHDAIQLCLVEKGAIRVTIHQQEHILHAGEGCFIHTNVLHTIHPFQDPHSTYLCINAELPLLTGFQSSIVEAKYIAPTIGSSQYSGCILHPENPKEQDILQSIAAIALAEEEKSYGYEGEIMAEMARISHRLILCFREREKAPTPPHNIEDERLKIMLSYIREHYGEKLSLESIAAAAHLCTAQCCRFFKGSTGKTIGTYLTEYRIEASIQKLRNTELSISAIAYECGFSSTSHYIDRFKKHTGLTPLAYRKGLRRQPAPKLENR